MWPYKEIRREAFEQVKDKVETIMIRYGAIACNISLPYADKTASVYAGNDVIWISNRSAYMYQGKYYRVCEVCFDRPLIVIECGDFDELLHNRMEDAAPFPYDLSEDLLEKEVTYSLGILPYPTV